MYKFNLMTQLILKKKSPAGTDEAKQGILNLFGKTFLTIGKYAQGVIYFCENIIKKLIRES